MRSWPYFYESTLEHLFIIFNHFHRRITNSVKALTTYTIVNIFLFFFKFFIYSFISVDFCLHAIIICVLFCTYFDG